MVAGTSETVSDSPLGTLEPRDGLEREYRTLFLVGCPRSGTTWVQLLLGQSPRVATAPETQIFSYYLDQFRRQWGIEHTGPSAKEQGGAGLSRLLSEEDFLELCGHTALRVLDRIHQKKRGADVVLEKSPRHALLVDWILDIFRDAFILHVVRDPRDAAASIVEAGRSWGRGWAPRNPIDAGRMWRAHVEGARQAKKKTSRYLEVRYEDLREEPVSGLGKILDWIGIPASREFCVKAVESCALDRMRESRGTSERPTPGTKSPRGFFGRGQVGGWEQRIGHSGARSVESVCFDLMVSYDYEPKLVSSDRRSPRIFLHDGIQRVRESIDWQLQRLLFRV